MNLSSSYSYHPQPQPYLQPYGYVQLYNPQNSMLPPYGAANPALLTVSTSVTQPVPPQQASGATSLPAISPTTAAIPTPTAASAPPTAQTASIPPSDISLPSHTPTTTSASPTAQMALIPLSVPTSTTNISLSSHIPTTTNSTPSHAPASQTLASAADVPPASQVPDSTANIPTPDKATSDSDDGAEEEPMLRSEGLPGLDELEACERMVKKFGEWVLKDSKVEGMEPSDFYEHMGEKVLRAQRRKTCWNNYLSYATSPEFKQEELNRLKGTKLEWDAKGDTEARSLIDVWNMIQEIKAVQKKGQRKRTFKAAVAQLKKFAEYLQNRYNIHLWAILAGGQIRSNQLYTFVCGLHESAGFAKGVLAVGKDDIGELFQAWIFDRNAAKFTNQQITAMAHVRGLKVTGPGIDEEMGPPATATPPAQPSSPAPSIKVHSTTRTGAPGKKVKKENVRDVSSRNASCMETLNKLFKGTNLPWSTLAAEWNSASKSPTIHRGYTIRGQTSTARPIVVSTVYPQIPSKKGSTTSRTTTSPLTSIEDEASLSSPSALTTPKAGPSKNLKPITMDEFRNGGFSSLDPALLKRPATSKSTGEGPPNKKAAKQGSEAS
ncbi:hypothetical protein AAF712_008792 [Marasmius tenuissimus]|uniref:Uncharacterized protein n=1 Tax=Marasmius tenuissimus TaxID=585030 RepID=A0ABR2ZV84_9AGAR